VLRRSISIVAGLAASLTLAAAANAAGLGRLTVLSTLGEPLAAEIEIVSLQPGEDEGLAARLASADVFAQAGIDVSPALNTVRITIERRDKRPYLRVTTRDAISEPFLDLLIELQWSSGRLVREYTFLLDPPEYRSRQQAIAAAPLAPPPASRPKSRRRRPPPRSRSLPRSRSPPRRRLLPLRPRSSDADPGARRDAGGARRSGGKARGGEAGGGRSRRRTPMK